MALDRDNYRIDRDVDDFDPSLYEKDTGRSNFMSFLIGGVVVAGGLLAFLFYDGGTLNNGRDITATGSPTIQAPAAPAAPSINTPSNGQ